MNPHTSQKSHVFPDAALRHTVTMENGSRIVVYVDPSETFGHAFARAGYDANSIRTVSHYGPIWYESDSSVATR